MGKKVFLPKSSLNEEYSNFGYGRTNKKWISKLPKYQRNSSEKLPVNPLVTVIIANYNNGRYLRKMMDSLVNQTIGLDNMQILFIDDKSTDDSLKIMEDYVNNYDSIEIIAFEENTGGAHGPRNQGILLTKGKYVVFLDADDWYSDNGIEVLVNLLESSDDSFGVSKISYIRHGEVSVLSPAYSDREVANRNYDDLPYEFYNWLGPQGIILRSEVVIDNNLHFVDQRVADDVTFFYEALRLSETISQTTIFTTYVNRDSDNVSLTKRLGETFMVSWLRSLSYIFNEFEFDNSMKLFLAKRLEWLVIDFCLRKDTAYGFNEESLEKFKHYIDFYLGDLSYDPSKYFKTDARKIAYSYLQNEQYNELIKFLDWFSLPRVDKNIELENGLYVEIPKDSNLPKVVDNYIARAKDVKLGKDFLVINFELYTREKINNADIRSLSDPTINFILPIKNIENSLYELKIPYESLQNLSSGLYTINIVTNIYNQHTIKIGSCKKYIYSSSLIASINGNISLNIQSEINKWKLRKRKMPYWTSKIPEATRLITNGNLKEFNKKIHVYFKRNRSKKG